MSWELGSLFSTCMWYLYRYVCRYLYRYDPGYGSNYLICKFKKKKMRHGILFTSQCHDFDQEYPLQKFISIRCLQIHTCFFHNNHVSVIDLFLHIKCWRNSWGYLTSNQRNAQNIRTTESVSGPKEWQHKYTQKWKKYMYPTLLLIDSSFTF